MPSAHSLRVHTIVYTVALLLLMSSMSMTQSAQSIVDQFYPNRLNPKSSEERHTCLAIVASDGSRPAVIVAGYTDGTRAMARVISRIADGSYSVASDSDDSLQMVGTACTIELSDFTGDGIADVFLTFDGRQGWAFLLVSNVLANVTPTSPDGDRNSTLFANPSLCDVLHDGSQQVCTVANARTITPRLPEQIFATTGGTFVLLRSVVAVRTFEAGWDDATRHTSFPIISDSVGPFAVEIVNGVRGGSRRLKSGTVSVNGVQVLNDSQINDLVEFTEGAVPSLMGANNLDLSLTGASNATITVIVRDGTVR